MEKYANGLKVESIIAWLEKQGEKLPMGFYFVNSEGKKFYSDTFKYGDVILHIEKQGKQETLCDKCRKEQPSHSCQDITALGRCALEHEQKPVDKVEPIKVGNWTIFNPELRKLNDKPIWSEDDDVHLRDAIYAAENIYIDKCGKEELVAWLKSLKERLKGE